MVSFGFQFFVFRGLLRITEKNGVKRSCFRVFYVSSLIWAIRGVFFLFKLLFSRSQVRHGVRHARARAKQLVVDSRDLVRRPSLRDAYDGSFGDSSFHG